MYGRIVSGNRVTEYYEEVSRRAEKTGKCICGKRVKRARTFTQTLSPFNKNKDGELKTEHEIIGELQEEAQKWKDEPAMHYRKEIYKMTDKEKELYKKGTWVLTCGEVDPEKYKKK